MRRRGQILVAIGVLVGSGITGSMVQARTGAPVKMALARVASTRYAAAGRLPAWNGRRGQTVAVAPPRTQVRIVEPYDARGRLKPGLHVVARLSGSCFAGSLKAYRADAWRCIVDNSIIDPCFQSPVSVGRPTSLACLPDPWSGVVLLKLKGALPRKYGDTGKPGQDTAWALTLANGDRCTWIPGATTAVGNLRLNYGCISHARAYDANVYGLPNRTREPWTVLVFRGSVRPSRAQLVPARVRVAWL